jgi:hypothetical protein
MVLIRRLRIMGEPYPISEVGEAAPSGIVVPPEHNAVQVEFAPPGFPAGFATAVSVQAGKPRR